MTTHYTAGGSGTWAPACKPEPGYCTLDKDLVTCPDCKALDALSSLTLDLVPLADLWADLRDQGSDHEAEGIVGAIGVMSGKSYREVWDLLESVRLRRHGGTVKFVHAPF